MKPKTVSQPVRPLHVIAQEIAQNWHPVNHPAVPYLRAMGVLHDINQSYGADSARSIVLYFLANAGTWRGETARRIKAELKAMAGVK